MLLEVVLRSHRAPREAKLGPSLAAQCVLRQRPLVLELVLAGPRIVDRLDSTRVQDGVNMKLLHLVAGHAERVRFVRVVEEGLGSAVRRQRV